MALLETFTENFDGTTLDAKWMAPILAGDGTLSVADGKLIETVTSTLNDNATARSVAGVYTVQNSSIYAQVSPPVGSANVATSLRLISQVAGYILGVRCLGTQMQRQIGLNATWTNISGQTYNSSWNYWRIRTDAANVVYIDKSTDGVTWVLVLNTAFVADTAKFPTVQIRLDTLKASSAGGGGTSTFGSVNALDVAPGSGSAPDSVTDTDTTGEPDTAYVPTPDSTTDGDTISGPDAAYISQPDSVTDGETLTGPTADNVTVIAPDGVTDPDAVGTPVTSRYPLPTSVTDGIAIGTPDVAFTPTQINPGSVSDIGPVGAPTITFKAYYVGGYGQGPYGGGLYSEAWIEPGSVTDPETVGVPGADMYPAATPDSIVDGETLPMAVLGGDAVGTDVRPLSIIDEEVFDDVPVSFYGNDLYGQGLYGKGLYGKGQVGEADPHDPTVPDATNYLYGAGTYNEGPYFGLVDAPTDTNPGDNLTYGTGTYNWGIYYGAVVSVVDAQPLFAPTVGYTLPALHILGVGPWSPVIQWRGAINYRVPGGNRPSRPVMALPAATSKGFTLRLNEGSEARAELALPRGSAVLIDEMDTDLWWRRKDPRTKMLEVIGRFNTSHVNMSTSDTGVSVSLQFDDYQTVLQERLVLRYLHPTAKPNPESMWAKGTKVTDILAFAIPANTRLDLSEVTGATPYPLGNITQAYHLAPGTTVGDVFDQLNAISGIRWEWWIETPIDIDAAPKLRFQIGNRGTDKGVVLHDLGKGPSPIAAWTRNGAADNYANTLLYMGTDGGVLETIDAQILQYGQRDTQASYPLDGTQMALLRAAAKRKLEKLADRRPTYTITLAAGFWRGRHHIDIGDTVTLLIRLGKERIYEKYRVSELTVEIDDVGAEDVTVTLGTPLASADGRSKRSPIMRLVRTLKQYNVPAGAKEIPLETE